ncbi:MAG: tRNA (guanosine(46)-N7)-methyltransferase TrmB [Acidiferrobacterales bacterium]
MTQPPLPRRPIRSFVRREGRLTSGQARALEDLWPRFGIEPGETEIDFASVFGRVASVVLEIGFGDGETFAAIAAAHPQNNYIGMEVHRPGVGSLLLRLKEQEIKNVRVICDDASNVMQSNIADESLDAIYLFFPDPWPKRKHHKRRLVRPAFIQQLRRKLKIGGTFNMATDWQDYADHMMRVMLAAKGFTNTAGKGKFSPKPEFRPETKFERRGLKLGHGVWDLVFRREN